MAQRRGVAVVSVLAVLLLMAACGGGGATSGIRDSSLPTTQGSTAPVKNVFLSNDNQSGFAGAPLSMPLQVLLQDAQGYGVSGIKVDFTSADGVQLIPASVVTSPGGYARTMARLPNIPLRTFKVNVTASSGHTAQFSLSSRPRILAKYGNITGSMSVSSDGRAIGSGQILNPDGTLQQRLGLPNLRGDCGAGCYFLNYGNIFLRPVAGFMMFYDDQFTFQRTVDVAAINAQVTGTFMPCCDLPDDIDASGTMYFHNGMGTQIRIDSSGKLIDAVPATPALDSTTVRNAALNGDGNFVLLTEGYGAFTLREYSRNGTQIQEQVVPGWPSGFWGHPTMLKNRTGGFLLIDEYGTAAWYDSKLRLLNTFNIHLADGTRITISQFVPIGVDGQGNIFFSNSLKADSTGKVLWISGAVPGQEPPWPIVEENHVLEGCTGADPLSPTLYVAGAKFVKGEFQSNVPVPASATAMAVTSAGEIYWTGGAGQWDLAKGWLVVTDLAGKVLRQLDYAAMKSPHSIAVAPDGTKYVSDVPANAIHVIDAADVYVRALPLNEDLQLPTEASLVFSPDGNLLVRTTTTVRKIAPSGAELWSRKIERRGWSGSIAVDGANRAFVANNDEFLVIDSSGNIVASPTPASSASYRVVSGGGRVYLITSGVIQEVSGE